MLRCAEVRKTWRRQAWLNRGEDGPPEGDWKAIGDSDWRQSECAHRDRRWRLRRCVPLCALPTSAHSAKPSQTNAYRRDASHVMALRRSLSLRASREFNLSSYHHARSPCQLSICAITCWALWEPRRQHGHAGGFCIIRLRPSSLRRKREVGASASGNRGSEPYVLLCRMSMLTSYSSVTNWI